MLDKTVKSEWGMVCPACGKDDQIDIVAKVRVRLTPDGTDADKSDVGDHEWNEDSECFCVGCGHSAKAWRFGMVDATP